METLEWKTVDKSKWGEGAWNNEPDKKQWQDAETGLPCLIVRARQTGSLCGYVGVPSTHGAHGLSYDGTPDADFQARLNMNRQRLRAMGKLMDGGADFTAASEKVWEGEGERQEPTGIGKMVYEVSVHGGLTFAGECQEGGDPSQLICHVPAPGEPDDIWWFGFDCSHAWDLSPGMRAMMREINERANITFSAYSRDDIYRDLAYVEGEVRSLAKQLAEMVLMIEGPHA
jgi:hypothetical protein